jgi:hypothetical protein
MVLTVKLWQHQLVHYYRSLEFAFKLDRTSGKIVFSISSVMSRYDFAVLTVNSGPS